jgi:hypothetical protein
LKDPNLVGAVGLLETALDESTEGSNTDTGTDQKHRAVRIELLGQWVSHQTLEHGDVYLRVAFASVSGSQKLMSLSLKETGSHTSTAATSPVHGVVDCDSNLNQTALSMLSEGV